METVKTVEDLTKDESLIGCYNYEEERKRELEEGILQFDSKMHRNFERAN